MKKKSEKNKKLIADGSMTPLLVNSIIMTSCLSENWAMHIGIITVCPHCIRYQTMFKCNKNP